MWPILWSVSAHHGEAADPDLLVWIKSRLDQLTQLGPWTVVALLGLLILTIPLSIGLLYVMRRDRPGSGPS